MDRQKLTEGRGDARSGGGGRGRGDFGSRGRGDRGDAGSRGRGAGRGDAGSRGGGRGRGDFGSREEGACGGDFGSRDGGRRDFGSRRREDSASRGRGREFTMASKPTNPELDTYLRGLNVLIDENTEHGIHANEISRILLWIATNHPELLKKNSKKLKNVSVGHLHFPKSWQ